MAQDNSGDQRIVISAINCNEDTLSLFDSFAKDNGFHILKEHKEHCEQDNEYTYMVYMSK